MGKDNLKDETANSTNTVLADSNFFSTEDVNKILDAYQVECQLKYNNGTVPDAREWFAKKNLFLLTSVYTHPTK